MSVLRVVFRPKSIAVAAIFIVFAVRLIFVVIRTALTSVGVGAVIKSEQWFRKLVKLLIIFVSAAGFLLQIHDFLQLYWEYSVIPSEGKLSDMKMPAITICDENLIRRRYLCERKPDMCTFNHDDNPSFFCERLYLYCMDKQNFYGKAPKVITKYSEEFLDINFTKDYGFQIEDNYLQCEWSTRMTSEMEDTWTTSNSCGTFEFVRGMSERSLPGACYKFNSKPQMSDAEFQSDSQLRMTARWRTEDAILKMNGFSPSLPGFRSYVIAFHHPGHISNPFLEGFRIEHGKRYSIEVMQVDTVRLPSPYATKCFDYEKEWKRNHFKGPIGRKDCEANCEINIKFEAFGCVPRTLEYPTDKKLCTEQKHYDERLREKLQKCIEECRDACKDTSYIQNIKVVDKIDHETALEDYGTQTVAVLDVSFDIANSKTVEYKPKYNSVELFSNIGSYLGMWLGWSLLAIFDFFEIIFNLGVYTFTLGRKKKNWVEPFVARNAPRREVF